MTGAEGHAASYGTNFNFAFPYKISGGHPTVLITTQEQHSVSVTVSVPGIGFTDTTGVSCDQVAEIVLPEEAAIQDNSSGKYNRTVIVDATGLVSVHGYYVSVNTAAGFLVLPTRVLDRHYVLTSWARNTGETYKSYLSELVVSALQDKTNVIIKGREDFEIVLQQHQVYQLVADGSNVTDVTGFTVTADIPISVMSGHQCAVIPIGGCDYLMEHIPPIRALGNHYVIAPFMDRQAGYVYRVIATASGMTNITISDGQIISLSTGQFYNGDVHDNAVVIITSDKPVLLSQYAKGRNFTAAGVPRLGDPFMIVIPSTSAYSNNVTFPVPTLSNNQQKYYINIIIACAHSDSIALDDQPLIYQNSTMLPTREGEYCVLQTPIATGFHSVTHPSPDASFLVLVYGFAEAESYGYVAGYNIGSADALKPIPSTISTGKKTLATRHIYYTSYKNNAK